MSRDRAVTALDRLESRRRRSIADRFAVADATNPAVDLACRRSHVALDEHRQEDVVGDSVRTGALPRA